MLHQMLVQDLRVATWLVVVGVAADLQLPSWLEACEAPTMVVLSDGCAVDEFSLLLGIGQRERVDLRAEWLSTENTEALWYQYNDPRCNGLNGPEYWRERYRNLQLIGMEIRPLKSLDTVLESWHPSRRDGGFIVWSVPDHQPLLTAKSLCRCSCLVIPDVEDPALNKSLGSYNLSPDPSDNHVWRRDKYAVLRADCDQLITSLVAIKDEIDEILDLMN